MTHVGRLLAVGCALLATAAPALGRTLEVGPERDLKLPSEAAKIAKNGDRVAIDPGSYFDCSMWRASGITVEAADTSPVAAPVVLTDRACAGKASFVIDGGDVTLRGLTFTRIRVPDGNGAGIRAEGRNLTVEHCVFVNNQMGILAADRPDGFLVVADSVFTDNGACDNGHCVGALGVGRLARLRIERSQFKDPRGSQPSDGAPTAGMQIVSAAQATELVDNRIEDGDGASSFLVAYSAAGSLRMTGNTLEKGPKLENARAAILAGGADWGGATSLVFRHNTLVNHAGRPGVFLLNLTGVTPRFDANSLDARDTLVSSDGIWRHRLGYLLVTAKDTARHAVGSLLRGLEALLTGS